MPPDPAQNDADVERSFEQRLDASGLSETLGTDERTLLYAELKIAARQQLRSIGAPATLQTTAVVHEAWLRLRDNKAFEDHAHFMATAALAMRYVIIDHIRSTTRDKRSRPDTPQETNSATYTDPSRHSEILAVHEALAELAVLDARCVRVVECRYFAGYTNNETANALDVDERTVRRDWDFARAWLRERLTEASP